MPPTLERADRAFAYLVRNWIAYPEEGARRQTIVKDGNCQYDLLCLAAGAALQEHTASRNALVYGVEGAGTLTLNGKPYSLQPGMFAFMPAQTPHAIHAANNLAFLLVLSE